MDSQAEYNARRVMRRSKQSSSKAAAPALGRANSASRRIFLLSAPSGTGKTTIIRAILEAEPGLRKIVTTTCRKPRPGEVDGEDYYFVSRQAFEQLIKNNQLVEWKEHFGNFYGLERRELKKEPKRDAIFDMDVFGKGEFLSSVTENCATIFLAPPSIETIEHRIRARGSYSEAQLQERVGRALQEMELADTYDYVVVNRTVEDTVKEVREIIHQTSKEAGSANAYVAVEGLIGAGKTTLAQVIAASTGARLYLDPNEKNSFLRDFYLSKKSFALETELSFLLLRSRLLHQIKQDLLANRLVLADFTIWRSDVFAQVNLDARSYRLFKRLYDVMERRAPIPDLVIWIEADDSLVIRRIKTRGKPEEILGVGEVYLRELRTSYDKVLMGNQSIETMKVSAKKLDLTRSNRDLALIVKRLQRPKARGRK